jgi:hypothetical protein
MTTLQSISAAVNWHIRTNENFAATSPAALFAQKASTTTGLTLGYYGGILDGVSYADGTHLLTASTTRYVVVQRSTGTVSSSTATTNWNDSTYMRMGVAVVGTSTITSWTDWRQSFTTASSGDVIGPGSAASGSVATFNGTTGKLIQDGAVLLSALAPKASPALTGTATAVNVTFSGLALTAASATGGAGLRIPPGAAPTSPVDGDMWTTTAGAYIRINGVTVGPLASAAGSATWGAITGTLSAQTDLQTALDAKAAVGIPQNSQSTAYTLVLADANKHILHPSADTTARTMTIPANSSVAFPIGTAVTFINQNAAGVMTIAITTDTMRLAGAGTTGSRTLAANGSATALKITSTEWIISGSGLT